MPLPLYQPAYCEENVWHLCRSEDIAGAPRFVLFVTNEVKACAFRAQRAGRDADDVVLWDYHVLLVSQMDGAWVVWDLDTTLGFGVGLERYLAESFAAAAGPTLPVFRVIDADEYVRRFDSDRSHMRLADGGWLAPPPVWEPIQSEDRPVTLARLLDLQDSAMGWTVRLSELVATLTARGTRR